MTSDTAWLKKLLPLLTLYFCWTYLDPNLSYYMSTNGLFQTEWPSETTLPVSSEYLRTLLMLFEPSGFQFLIGVGILCSFGFLMPHIRFVFLIATILTLLIQSLFLLRNPSFYVIHRPYIGMLLMFLPFVFWQQRRTLNRSAMDWLWIATSITYLASAVSKVSEPLWLSGAALGELKGFPIRSTLLQGLPSDSLLCLVMTYSVIAAELFHGLLGYFPKFRLVAWLAVVGMHLAALPILQIYVATVPMIVFHLFLFDPEWTKLKFFRGPWIKSAPWDLLWVFSFIWIVPLTLLFSSDPRRETVAALLPLVILLSQGHKYAPHLLLAFDKKVLAHVKSQRPNLFRELAGLILFPTLIAGFAALLYDQQSDTKYFYFPVALLSAIYAGWTYFHFSQQNLGVLRIYRRLVTTASDPDLNRIEQYTVTSVALAITALVSTFANERLGFYLYFFSPLQMPSGIRAACLGMSMLAAVFLILHYKKRGVLNFTTFLAAIHFNVLTALLCLAPVYLGLFAISVSHWTQAIFLTTLQMSDAQADKRENQ